MVSEAHLSLLDVKKTKAFSRTGSQFSLDHWSTMETYGLVQGDLMGYKPVSSPFAAMDSFTKALQDSFPSPPLPSSIERTRDPYELESWLPLPLHETRAFRLGKRVTHKEKVDFLRCKPGEGWVSKFQSHVDLLLFFQFLDLEYQELGRQVITGMPAEILEAAAQVSIMSLAQRKSEHQGNCLLLDLGRMSSPKSFPGFPGLTETGYFKRMNWLITFGERKLAWDKHTDTAVSVSSPKWTNKRQCHT